MHKWIIYTVITSLLTGGFFYVKHRMDEATRLEAENKIIKNTVKGYEANESKKQEIRSLEDVDLIKRYCASSVFDVPHDECVASVTYVR